MRGTRRACVSCQHTYRQGRSRLAGDAAPHGPRCETQQQGRGRRRCLPSHDTRATVHSLDPQMCAWGAINQPDGRLSPQGAACAMMMAQHPVVAHNTFVKPQSSYGTGQMGCGCARRGVRGSVACEQARQCTSAADIDAVNPTRNQPDESRRILRLSNFWSPIMMSHRDSYDKSPVSATLYCTAVPPLTASLGLQFRRVTHDLPPFEPFIAGPGGGRARPVAAGLEAQAQSETARPVHNRLIWCIHSAK